jgi:hypothetical protein
MTTNNNFRVKNGLEVNGPVDVKNNNLNNVTSITMSQTGGAKSINGADQINLGGNYPGAPGDVQINKQGNGGYFRLRVEGQNVLEMNNTEAIFNKPLYTQHQLTIQSAQGLKFSDNTVQTTAAAPFTGTAPLLKATEQLTVGTVRILENEAGELAILPAASFADIIDTQFEFQGSDVTDEVTQATVTSTRNQATFDSVQVPLAGLTSWFNTTGGPPNSNYFTAYSNAGYNFSSMTNSLNWTIDMWIRPESSGSGAGNQILVNGSGFGDGPNNIYLSVDNDVPNNGTLRLNGMSGPQISSGAWHHVGVMRKNGVMYWLLDGSATEVSGNPNVPFGNGLEFLGASGAPGSPFALGYASGIRVSKDTALFSSGSYTQPVAADYILNSGAAETATINVGAVKFADNTVITSAPTSANQGLNTTDSVKFSDISLTNVNIDDDGKELKIRAYSGDPKWDNVTFFMNGESISDVKNSTSLTVNSVSTSTTQVKYGGSSLEFTVSNGLNTVNQESYLYPGDQDFSIDFWIWPSSSSNGNGYQRAFALLGTLNLNLQKDESGGVWKFEENGGGGFGSPGNFTMTDDTWHHLAFQRIGVTGQLFIDGVLQLTWVYPKGSALGSGQLGLNSDGFYKFIGFMDNVRFMKGATVFNTTTPSVPTGADYGAWQLIDAGINVSSTRLIPLAAAPATPAAGMMAVSNGIGWDPATDGDEHLNIYLNGAWVQIA